MTMAQIIRTICDVHLAKGVEVDATTWQVLIRKQGTRTQQRDVDLCGECSAALEAVAAFVLELGRTDGQAQPRRAAAAVTATAGDVSAIDGTKRGCPVPGCTSKVSRSNLPRHLRDLHDMDDAAVAELVGTERPNQAGAFPCPDCDFIAVRAAGLGAHRHRKHGYTSPSRGAVAV